MFEFGVMASEGAPPRVDSCSGGRRAVSNRPCRTDLWPCLGCRIGLSRSACVSPMPELDDRSRGRLLPVSALRPRLLAVVGEAAGILTHRSDRLGQSGGYGEAFPAAPEPMLLGVAYWRLTARSIQSQTAGTFEKP